MGLAALAGCSGLLGGSGAVAGDSWPGYQRGPAKTGANPAASGPGEDLDRRWETTANSLVAELAKESLAPRVSPPAVVDDTVYAAVAALDLEIGLHLVALDAAEGTLEWSTKAVDSYGRPGTGPVRPTVVDGSVVVTNPGPVSGPAAASVDVESRAVDWRGGDDHYTVTAGTHRDGQLVFGESTAWALETDGSVAWAFAEGERPRRARVDQPPTVTEDGAYVPTSAHLVALDDAGEKRWERNLAFESELFQTRTRPYTPAAGDAIYVAAGNLEARADGRLLALDPADGTTRWEFKPDFDAARREELARLAHENYRTIPPFGVGIYSTPVLADGTLYALGRTMPEEAPLEGTVPTLFAIDAGSGQRQWATELPENFGLAPPVTAGGIVYVPTVAGLTAVDAGSGERLTTGTLTEAFPDGLAVVGDAVFASDRGSLVALGP